MVNEFQPVLTSIRTGWDGVGGVVVRKVNGAWDKIVKE